MNEQICGAPEIEALFQQMNAHFCTMRKASAEKYWTTIHRGGVLQPRRGALSQSEVEERCIAVAAVEERARRAFESEREQFIDWLFEVIPLSQQERSVWATFKHRVPCSNREALTTFMTDILSAENLAYSDLSLRCFMGGLHAYLLPVSVNIVAR